MQVGIRMWQYGTLGLVSLVLSLVGLYQWGAWRWMRATQRWQKTIHPNHLVNAPLAVKPADLESLPPPVGRYLAAVLTPTAFGMERATIEHRGEFNLSPDSVRWKPFLSTQQVNVLTPGFVWDARVKMLPGVSIRVHDAYWAGRGYLHAALFGLVPVAHQAGDVALAEGELMRYLAEAVWYPAALLPRPGLQWQSVDNRSAVATLSDAGIQVSLRFTFAESGLVETVSADRRERKVGAKSIPTRWEGRFWNYSRRDGLLIPLEGEVAWCPDSGPVPYWRGKIESLAYHCLPDAPE